MTQPFPGHPFTPAPPGQPPTPVAHPVNAVVVKDPNLGTVLVASLGQSGSNIQIATRVALTAVRTYNTTGNIHTQVPTAPVGVAYLRLDGTVIESFDEGTACALDVAVAVPAGSQLDVVWPELGAGAAIGVVGFAGNTDDTATATFYVIAGTQ